MSYLNIPAATDTLATSQGQIQTNFALLLTAIAKDHIPMTDPTVANRGKHKYSVYPTVDSLAIPSPVTTATEGALYTKNIGGKPFLFYRQNNSGSEIQMSAKTPITATPGFTFLPGNAGALYMMWGSLGPIAVHDVATPVNYAALGLPNFSAPAYSIQVTITHSTVSSAFSYVVTGTNAATGFSAANTGNGHSLFWVAIGPA